MIKSDISKKRTLKSLVLHIALINISAMALSACQNTQTLPLDNNNPTHSLFSSDAQLFNYEANPSTAQTTQDFFLQALKNHLNQDQISVSLMRYQVTPYVNDDIIEAEDQSLFRTFIELRNYQDETYGYDYGDYYDSFYDDYEPEPAFRTEEEYLEDSGDELYLRYDDEIKGTLPFPDYSVTREVGMSEEYEERNSSLYYYAYNHDDCVIDYSIAIDDLIMEDPTLTINDERIEPAREEYDECVSEVKDEYQEDIDAAIGYQTTYPTNQDSCASNYHNDLAAILSANRSNTEVSYDHYDVVYQTYRVCYNQVSDKQDLEPESYINYGTSEKSLNYTVAKLKCDQTLFDQQKALNDAGNTLAASPELHAAIYYNDYSTCVFNAEQEILYAEDEDEVEDEDNEQNIEDYVSEDNPSTADSDIETDIDGDIDTDDLETVEDILANNSEIIDNEDEDIDDEYEGTEEDDTTEYESGQEKFEDDLANLNIEGFLKDYRDMKLQQLEKENDEDDRAYDRWKSSRGVSFFLDFFQRTPEQLEARNHYIYQPLSITTVSRYQPSKQRYTAIYDYNFTTPTYTASVQMPVEFDFQNAKLTFDPGALMPVMAIISPEDTPMPEDLEGKVVTFELPEGMDAIPTDILHQTFMDAMQYGLSSLSPEYFTEFTLQNDSYAQQLGATKGIKVYLGIKQSGELMGIIIKHLTYDLKSYVDANPQDFPEDHAIRNTLDNWMLYNQGFQAKDVGSVLQLIEAIAPISFDKFNYFYFNEQGQIIGKQSRTDLGSYLTQSNYSIIQQTRYDRQAFDSMPASRELDTLFFTDRNSIDGNEWLESRNAEKELMREAEYARYEYDLPSFEKEYDDLYGYDYAEEIDETDDDSTEDESTENHNDGDLSDNTELLNEGLNGDPAVTETTEITITQTIKTAENDDVDETP